MRMFRIMTGITMFVLSMAMAVEYCFAHGAVEYIDMASYTTAKRGEVAFHCQADYYVVDETDPASDKWEYTPGITWGITGNLMLDFHFHFAKFGMSHLAEGVDTATYYPHGPSPMIEAMALTLQYRLLEERVLPVDIGFTFAYEYPFPTSQQLLGGEQVFEIGAVLSKNFGVHSNVCANIKFKRDGTAHTLGWAVGAKTPLTAAPHGPAAGVEISGDYDLETAQVSISLMPGIYLPLQENIVFKTGIQFRLQGGDYLRAMAGLFYTL